MNACRNGVGKPSALSNTLDPVTVASCRRALVTLIAGLSLAACAGLLQRPETPQVSLADLHIVEFNLFEQRYRLALRIQNPNDFELAITGISYVLELNDHPFATGVSNEPVTVPAFGEALLTVDVVSNLARAIAQLHGLGKSGKEGDRGSRSLRYALTGKISLSSHSLLIPFKQDGELLLFTPDEGVQI